MIVRVVKTQAELDAAIADKVDQIEIRSETGVWIKVGACDSSTVVACDSSTVVAHDSATVTAYDSSTVAAYDSSTVAAYDSSTVATYDSSTVAAYDSAKVMAYDSSKVRAHHSAKVWAFNASTVTARDTSTVTARDTSTVRAYDLCKVTACLSSTVTAWNSSTVWVCGSSTVTAYDLSTVRAYDSSTVRAWGSSTVKAESQVAVHLHSDRAGVTGGVVIDYTAEPSDAEAWCAWHGVEVTDGIATLYKAVNDVWTTIRGVDYSPGSTPEAEDWRPDGECGGGLHFSPTPAQALAYSPGATRFVAVGVRLDELSPILGPHAKAKARRVVTACREVTIYD